MNIQSELEVSINQSVGVVVICGGESKERGISLNSARSVMDHLQSSDIELTFVYFDQNLNPYEISRAQLYSNTPSDFDFKLANVGNPLTKDNVKSLISKADIVFPLIHGNFGEGGELQEMLEEIGTPHIGLDSKSCRRVYDKYTATKELEAAGFKTLQCELVEKNSNNKLETISAFFENNKLSQVVVKPCNTGSSIGVSVANSPNEALNAAQLIFDEEMDTRVIVEPLCAGSEFTIIVLEARNENSTSNESEAVALIPTEIEILSDDKLFSYRKKYLATHQTILHSPPRFADEKTEEIRKGAERIFNHFQMKDFVRVDGWVLESGEVIFSDINPISGMEQNSFFFQQCAQIGMSHRDALRYLVKTAADRNEIEFDHSDLSTQSIREKMPVLFGGNTAERQVSLMSGTNVWLKLIDSGKYEPTPCFLDSKQNVWQLPYDYALNHTTEEIETLCKNSGEREARLKIYRDEIRSRLKIMGEFSSISTFTPTKQTLTDFVNSNSKVFIALHGGFGENGELQSLLRENGVAYTASGPEGSKIGMDKARTAEEISHLKSQGIYSAKKRSIKMDEIISIGFDALWVELTQDLNANKAEGTIIVKPQDDGCSAGIARLASKEDLKNYVECVSSNLPRIPAGVLSLESEPIELSLEIPNKLLFEEFIVTDDISIQGNDLVWNHKTGLIEITVGVMGKEGEMKAMSPSITVASGNILSLEEKFQGGTGVNITPPPEEFVSKKVTEKAKEKIALVANTIGLRGFARIDAFLDIKTGEIIVIEANTIPGMTPSTVIYHQALDEEKRMYPRDFLEAVLEYSAS